MTGNFFIGTHGTLTKTLQFPGVKESKQPGAIDERLILSYHVYCNTGICGQTKVMILGGLSC